ncbi:phenol-soluble modulin export ABC transporter ATP-binding protein PmtA [Staphylococcus auricularis]|uniref:phenol-soluble modulin export ABC transporter ATP-binding protein PmtA n=1 Tax=Staphylococcus auricularis TaxID=29379 RepID=UPI003EBB5BA4
MNAIELEHVSYHQKKFELNDISFKVPKGYVTGFIGPNGSGKTTIIRLIMDLLQQDTGRITVFEHQMKDNAVNIKDRIGFIYSELYLNDKWKVKKVENIIAPFYSQWDHSIFAGYLQRFGIDEDAKIKSLSTGTKMKLSIAIAFSHHAELFILDEPTSGLDPIVRNEVLEMIQEELIDENKTVFISTHIISDLEKIADHLVYLKDGEIVVDNFIDELLDNYQIVQGNINQLDGELKALTTHIEYSQTGYTSLTTESNAFKELFGSDVVVTKPTIEALMVYLGKTDNAVIRQTRQPSMEEI